MRRIVSCALLFLVAASCSFYRPVYIGGQRRGVFQNCREVSRSRCDVGQCRGANMDHVTYHCSGTRSYARCVANFRCTAD